MLAKGETENGVISVLQTTDCATVLRTTDIVRERGQSLGSRRIHGSKADSMGYHQEIQDAWNPLSSSRQWTSLQANARHLGHHLGTNARGRRDSHPASQDCERCGVRRLQEYNRSSAENLSNSGKRFQGSLLIVKCRWLASLRAIIRIPTIVYTRRCELTPINRYRLTDNRYVLTENIHE